MSGEDESLLSIRGLTVEYGLVAGAVRALSGVDMDVPRGRIMGLVGESGSGKSTLALTVLRLIEWPGRIVAGEIRYGGKNLLAMGEEELNRIRGKEISIVFQNPFSSLNPVFKVGQQMVEGMMKHLGISKEEATRRAVEILNSLQLPEPEQLMDKYPHQLSGGMAQRVMIGIAISCQPRLLIADEPTSALDVTTQAQILELLKRLNAGQKTTILSITHNLALVAEICEYVVVMYAGSVVEHGDAVSAFQDPKHPYTMALMKAIPRIEDDSFIKSTIPGEVIGYESLRDCCVFHPRCPYAMDICRRRKPTAFTLAGGSRVHCWLYG